MIDRRKEIGHPVQCGELLPELEEMHSIFPSSAELEDLFDVPSSMVVGRNQGIELISPGGRVYDIEFASVALNRRQFDKHLVRIAEKEGARVLKGVSLLSIEDGLVRTSAGEVKPKVIVGADGPNTTTAREAGLQRPKVSYPAITCQCDGKFDPRVKMYFGAVAPGGYAWIIPKDNGANIGLGFDRRLCSERPSEALDKLTMALDLKARDPVLGFVPMSGPVRSTVAGNVLLVGDAAGQVMPSNGGGIPTAMIAGREAGKAIGGYLSGDSSLADYELRWRSQIGIPLRNSLRTRRLGSLFFPNDSLLGFSMALLGRRGLDRAIRCKRLFV